MDLSALTGTNSSIVGQATNDRRTIAENFDAFLSLLTTQLQNQNPLEPLDTNEFTAQLVQFSSVEQSIKTNQNLESLLALSTASTLTGAVSYLGKTVVAEGSSSQLSNGSAVWNYSLKSDAPDTNITIRDGSGQIVFSQKAELTAGSKQFTWDGKLANGQTAPDGLYTIEFAAKDAQGNAVPVSTLMEGVAEAVDMTGDQPTITVNGSQVLLSAIKSIKSTSSPSSLFS